uniref:Uncharacterized protein n=1 Tax=Opuntia streptacantha TaxID=393608 RepID=A0A7C9AW66_OPUST
MVFCAAIPLPAQLLRLRLRLRKIIAFLRYTKEYPLLVTLGFRWPQFSMNGFRKAMKSTARICIFSSTASGILDALPTLSRCQNGWRNTQACHCKIQPPNWS